MRNGFKRLVRGSQTGLLLASLLSATQVYAVGPIVATPSIYKVTVSEVGFHKVGDTAGVYTPYASGSGLYDIAAASPNANVGILTATGTLPPGTYDEIKFVVSKTMTLKGSADVGGGVTCRTVTGGAVIADPFGDGSVDQGYAGTTDPGAPEPEVVAVPSGTGVILPTGFTDLGTSFQGVVATNLTVEGTEVPRVTVRFDVTNAIDFGLTPGGACVVFPGAPTVTVDVA